MSGEKGGKMLIIVRPAPWWKIDVDFIFFFFFNIVTYNIINVIMSFFRIIFEMSNREN